MAATFPIRSTPRPASALIEGDLIIFGDDLVAVVGIDRHTDTVTLITEDQHGEQFIDPVSLDREFPVVRVA